MNRRTFLSGGALVFSLSLTGCAETAGGSNPNVEFRQDYPNVPDDLTAESATEFGAAYAEVEVHNWHVEEGVTGLDTECSAVFDREINDHFYVLASCHVTETREDDGTSVGHVPVSPVPLWITEDDVTVVERDDIYDSAFDPERGEPAPDDPPRGFQLLSFSNSHHKVGVTISSHDDAGVVFEGTYALPRFSGVIERGVFGEADAYDIRVTLGDGLSEVYEWKDSDRDVGIYVTFQEEVDIDLLPEDVRWE